MTRGIGIFVLALVGFYFVAVMQDRYLAIGYAVGLVYLASALPRRRTSGVKRTRERGY